MDALKNCEYANRMAQAPCSTGTSFFPSQETPRCWISSCGECERPALVKENALHFGSLWHYMR